MPKYNSVTVTIPAEADTGMVRTRVAKALTAADLAGEADAYIAATNMIREDPDALIAATRDWVNIEGADEVAASSTPFTTSATSKDNSLRGLVAPIPGAPRWQYAVINIGMFNTPERISETLGIAGANGWELVTVYDKSSNWSTAMEKGFMLLKRPVPDGLTPDTWCLMINRTMR